MDRRVARPEDLPPLQLRRLRDLDLDAPSGPGRGPYVSAASGVVRRADFVYEDGKILGSVVGTIDSDGEVRRLRTIDRAYKVEGVHATLETGVMTLTFVCDQDDPDVASPLLSATMPLDDAVEAAKVRPG